MSNLERAKERAEEAREKLDLSIRAITEQFYNTMRNKTDFLPLDPDVEELVMGGDGC